MNVIFDLDGTLADITHRLHFIQGEKKDWHKFYYACTRDTPIMPIVQIFHALRASEEGHSIEIWTGRSAEVRDKTLNWLHNFGLYTGYEINPPKPHVLTRMRPVDNYKKDHELKRSWLHHSIREGWKPDLVFEDRNRVVDMWREEGIQCIQVADNPN